MSAPGCPSHVVCVALDVGPYHADYGRTWCGRAGFYRDKPIPLADALATIEGGGELVNRGSREAPTPAVERRTLAEFGFVDASHALVSAREGGRHQICPDCATAMGAALAKGTYRR